MARKAPKSKLKTRAHSAKDEINARSRARRETQSALLEIGDRAVARRRNDLVPELRLEYLDVKSLRPAGRQLRTHDSSQVAKIKASIARHGVSRPILVNGENGVIDGHAVLEAAKALGLEKIPCVIARHLDALEERTLRLAINRLGEIGEWDFEELRAEFEELIELGGDLADTGFEMAEVDALLLEDEDDGEGGADALPGPSALTISRPGDLWQLGRHRLLQGDARDPASYERLMRPGELARMIFCDPPYNVKVVNNVTSNAAHREFACASGEMAPEEFAQFLRVALGAPLPFLLDGGLVAAFVDWRSVHVLIGCGLDLGLDLLNLIVWQKTNGGQGSLWRSQHELLPVFKKGLAAPINNVMLGKYGRWRSNVWSYPGGSSLGSEAREELAGHPTPKPVAMLADALLDVSDRDEIVIDPFVGSGSTLIAAEVTGRVCRAIEIDSQYCDLVVRRWQKRTGEAAIREQDGVSFDELERGAGNRDEASEEGV